MSESLQNELNRVLAECARLRKENKYHYKDQIYYLWIVAIN